MKKNCLLLFVILVLFSGCSKKEEVVDVGKKEEEVVKELISIKLKAPSKNRVSLKLGALIEVVFNPASIEEDISWTSSDETIATVDEAGFVYPVKEGTVYITATTSSGKSDTVEIFIYKPIEKLELSADSLQMYVGDVKKINAILTPVDATFGKITWDSSNPSIVSVSQDGTITAHDLGIAVITATSEEGLPVVCTVTVADKKQVLLNELVKMIDEGLVYDSGSYVKGEVKAGEYAFVRFDGAGSYYEELDMAGNIIENENFDSFGYVKVLQAGDLTTGGVLINVTAFKRLGVSGAKEIWEILNDVKDYNQSGYYKVGYDIKPGKYIVETLGGDGYYGVMSGPVGKSSIIRNDFYSGKKTVTISKGQYITLSGVKIYPKK